MPCFIIYEDDVILPTTNISPPRSSNPLSPPTSGIPGLDDDHEDPIVMYSHGSQYFSRAHSRASDEQEIDFDDFDSGSDRPNRRQDTEPLQPDSVVKQEDPDQGGNNGSKKSSKYNTKPPPLAPTQIAAMPKSKTPTSSKSARTSPKHRKSAVTPDKTASAASTPSQSSHKSRSRTISRRRSVRSETNKTPTPDYDVAAEIDDTEDDNDNGDGGGAADDNDNATLPEHNLRKRTLKQTNPFKVDKHEHQARKTGKAATTKMIEKAVKEEISSTQKQPAKKRTRTSSSSSQATKPKAKTKTSVSEKQAYHPAKVTFRVRLDGFAGAAAPTTLEKCSDIDKLMEFIVDSWEWRFNGARFSYAVASFPWLSIDSNILLRLGLEGSFHDMVNQVEGAPCWEESDQARCELDVTVYVQ